VACAAATIGHSEEAEGVLRSVLRTPAASQQQALRARIVLRAAEGVSDTQIAREMGVSLPTVGLWRRNFCERRAGGASRRAAVGPAEHCRDYPPDLAGASPRGFTVVIPAASFGTYALSRSVTRREAIAIAALAVALVQPFASVLSAETTFPVIMIPLQISLVAAGS
jgi:transposase-like protein